MSLMSELEDLGELMATNITAKGVSASASDGLTTLAGKILQISGGGGGGTTLFEDACNSASGLSNYGNPISLGSYSTATLSYDSTMNAYKLTSNSSDNKFIPITALDGLTEFKLTMEWYQPSASNHSSTAVEPVVGTTTKAGLCYTFFNDNNGFVRQRYSGGSWRGNDTLVSGIAYRDEWLRIELTIEDTSVTMKAYRMNSDTPFATDTYTLTNISTDYSTASNRVYGLGIGYANNSYGYFRNIKAESLGGGSDCSQYTTQINNAIEYINGSGS